MIAFVNVILMLQIDNDKYLHVNSIGLGLITVTIR